jgi:hypothetical protein
MTSGSSFSGFSSFASNLLDLDYSADKDVKAVFRLSKVLSMDVRPRLSSCTDLAAVNPLSIPTGIAFPVIAVFFITRAADGIGTSSGVIVRPVRLSAAN